MSAIATQRLSRRVPGLEAKDLRKLLGMKRGTPLDVMDAIPLALNARWAPVGVNGGVTLVPEILVEAQCVATLYRGGGSAENQVTARPALAKVSLRQT
jgi:hypothetical protein